MDALKDIQWRLRLIYVVVCLFGLIIIGRAFSIGVLQRDHWLSKKKEQTMKFVTKEATRGNVYSSDGSLLSTSLPIYDVRMDLGAEALRKTFTGKALDSLALCLSNLFPDKSKEAFKRDIQRGRDKRNRYFLLRKNVQHAELKIMRKFPILRGGRYKGGILEERRSKRTMPFQQLALRTLGRFQEDVKPVGIEGFYNDYLKGTGGKRLMQKISGGVWKPVNDENEVEPREGNDIVSTIDINIQDVAEAELMKQMIINNAENGCVVLMEVKTGYIRAIANLGRTADSSYVEKYNYAVGSRTEPGSTFKLASLMALFEDNLAKPTDIFDTHGGAVVFRNRVMKDSHEGGFGKIPLSRGFEVSSNTVFSQAVYRAYQNNPQKFVDRLKKFHLDQPLGIDIPGEASPFIRGPKDKGWSGTSLPWMAIGYETLFTPLQTLSLYNTVANNGKMMKPQFVEEIRHRGQVVKKFEPVVIDAAICSQATIDKIKPILEGVVERGSGVSLKNPYYKIAGKTGTAQVATAGGGGYGEKGAKKYQASFVGYFPADNPRYSCIVVINGPTSAGYYGNVVAGPVFKRVANKVYAQSIDIQDHSELPALAVNEAPKIKAGNSRDIEVITTELNIPAEFEDLWVHAGNIGGKLILNPCKNKAGCVPDVTGMGLRDALFLLENCGLRVKVAGRGMVKRQSVAPGTRIVKDAEVLIELT